MNISSPKDLNKITEKINKIISPGDYIFLNSNNSNKEVWTEFVSVIKFSAKVFLTMAMGAIGLSTNLKDLRSMGYKPFIVGFISLLTVGIVSLSAIEFFGSLVIN